MPGQISGPADGERVALIVIKIEIIVICRWREVGEAATYAAASLHVLPRIGQVGLCTIEQPGRPHGGLIAADPRRSQSERKKDIGIAQHVMVKEIARSGAKVVEVEAPAAKRDGDAELVLLIAFAAKWQEAEPLADGKIGQRAGERAQR